MQEAHLSLVEIGRRNNNPQSVVKPYKEKLWMMTTNSSSESFFTFACKCQCIRKRWISASREIIDKSIALENLPPE
jgi:hypothetical protein